MDEFFTQIWQIINESNLLNIVGALLILLIGYLAAWVIGRKSTKFIEKITSKPILLPDGREIFPVNHTARIFGKAVYGIIMLLAVIGCFSVLKLHAAAAPIQELISKIVAFLPNIAGALLLIFAAWVIAELVKMFFTSFLHYNIVQERWNKTGKNKEDSEKYIAYIVKAAGYTVYLFFLPAILNALNIYGITRPLQSMFEKFLTFIPNLAAAAVILLIGLWAANIARKAVKTLAVISKVDELTGKLNKSNIPGSCSAMIGWVVYILVALPVAAAALSALNIEILSGAIAVFFGGILNFAAAAAVSAVILFAALLAGDFAAGVLERVTAAWGIDEYFSMFNGSKSSEKKLKLSVIAGKLSRIALLVLALLAVCDIMELEKIASLIKRFAIFGGNIILSSAVILLGIKLAESAAAMLCGKCPVQFVYAVKAAVVIFTLALAISNLELGSQVVEITFALLLGALAVAGAIAFGIGGKEAAAKLLNEWLEKMKK